MSGGWRFSIDRGGTFTDVVAQTPDGRTIVRKVLSAVPGSTVDPAVRALRAILTEQGGEATSLDIKIGSTVATNALLERRGAPTVLVITQGHADALAIGWQSRPDLFARQIVKPAPLYDHVIEAVERVGPDGRVLLPLDEERARRDLNAAAAAGFRACAIICLHGWAFPEHERRLGAIAHAAGFSQVSLSHEVARLIKLIPRGDTTVADAYLNPIVRQHVDDVARDLGAAARLAFMQSNGGLAAAPAFRGRDAVLSGPAGGVVGMATAARRAGFARAIGFDMGGTSTDVAAFAGAYERASETVIAGVRLAAPMLAVHTIAAGGGSICRFDGTRLRVGPHSAGADPGPASYRRGGPLTITDCNLVLGRVQPDFFPAVFGSDGDQSLDQPAARRALEAVTDAVAAHGGGRSDPLALAEGFLAVAVEAMAEAIRAISLQRGDDPAQFVLVAFGGAGGQHACAVADAAGLPDVLIHPMAGVLSAWGIGIADLTAVVEATFDRPADDPSLGDAVGALAQEAVRRLRADEPSAEPQVAVTAHIRYAGADATLPLPFGPDLAAAFTAAHRARFGFETPDVAVIVARLTAAACAARPGLADGEAREPVSAPSPAGIIRLRAGGTDHDAPVWRREELPRGFVITGPALIAEAAATTVVDPGWRAVVTERLDLHLRRVTPRAAAPRADARVDPVRLALFANRFSAIAEEMGLALQASAASVNIKERLDFSCAVFDAAGGLVANAPHIPVHLGSMGDSVRAIAALRVSPGDVYALNAPYGGGTHLPDVTVVQPIFLAGRAAPAFFVAARGHHADIGGLTPGSMPPHSRTIQEEGVLLQDLLVVRDGRLREAAIREALAAGPWPARNPDQNLADLRAQIAACARGAAALLALVAQEGADVVAAYMGYVQDAAAAAIRSVLATLSPGAFAAPMDDGSTVRVTVDVAAGGASAVFDFTATSDQVDGNLNAPPAIARAASLYVLRSLVDDAIPLNDGCLAPVSVRTREGSLLRPRPPAAVVAGNVETSQVIVDALYGALGVLAASSGTMSNFTFGDATHQYYETIAGGAGAGPGFTGADAVQTHMTNSRLTDPEVLETRFPVLVERFAIRRGSGGRGRWRGGDGVVREIRFCAPMTAGILSNRRRTAPHGLAGGLSGAAGANFVRRADRRVEALGPTATVAMAAGDVFVIETPGGGGYGPPEPDEPPA